MLDRLCEWAANNAWFIWVPVVLFWGSIVAFACWPRKLSDLNNPKDFGC